MARLKVRLRGKIAYDINLSEGQSYMAGRKEDCDIVLMPEKGISREHFKLSSTDGAWSVEVVSRYGDVIVHGGKVQKLSLDHGQSFSVPPYEFEFLMTSAEESVVSEAAISAEGDGAGLEEKTVIGVAPSVPYIKVLDSSGGAKEMFRLEGGDTWVAGRESNGHIYIRDQRVSRRQFEIRKINAQYYIVDLGSVNGTLLNGNPVSTSEPTPIRSGDGISVLDNQMLFELHDPHFKNRLDMVNLQTLSPLVPAGNVGDGLVPYHQQSQMPMQYDPNAMMPTPHESAPMPAPAPPSGFDFQKHRIKLIAGAILLLAVVYYVSDGGDQKKPVVAQPAVQDPFQKLKPEQQLLVKQSYTLSKNLFMQGKYELAQNEITKILELVPDYEDIKEIQRLSREAIFIQDQKRRQEELEKARAEAEEKILKQVEECKKKINVNITMGEMDECVSNVMQFNPDHPKINELKAAVAKIESDREVRNASRAAHAQDVAKLKSMYARAESLRKAGKNLEAISAYQVVMNSKLPDPNGLKGVSDRNVTGIRAMMNSKTAAFQQDAEKSAQAGNLRAAIVALRKARQVDPENDMLQGKIDHHILDLKKQMMLLYQEGILEESFGNVEGSDSKAGAKDKWKKILELDIPDGEYYKKAYMKLKKYGAF